jgi:hypothetical protein
MKWNGIVGLVALIVSVLAIYQVKTTETSIDNTPIFTNTENKDEEVEIVDFMQFLLPFHEKLFWSLKAENKDLAEFYVHELGEKMLEVVKADVWREGRNLSEDMKTFGLKPLENIKNELNDSISVLEKYNNLTISCNSCHELHKVGFIKIKTPEINRFSNQIFIK